MRRVASALVALLFAAPAEADESPRFELAAYDMIGGCPDEAAFRAEVERRVHARTKTPLKVSIHVLQQPRSLDGTIDVIDANGGRSTRNVSALQCSEIVSAAALVVALAIDDAAESDPAPVTNATPPGPIPEVIPTVDPLTVGTDRSEPVVPEWEQSDLVFRAGVDGGLETGIVPHVVAALPIFVELGNERRSPGPHFEPRARLAWTFAASSRDSIPTGAATFHWWSGALDLCPLRLSFVTLGHRSLSDVRMCGRLELGELTGDGEGSPRPLTQHRLWAAWGVPFTFRIEVTPRFFIEADGGPRFPILRDQFTVSTGNSKLFRPPVVGTSVGIGAGVIFR
jgi:hypothetical protein